MPYARKSTKKTTYKKRYTRKRSTLDAKIKSIAKTVALRQQETKTRHVNVGNYKLNHNVSRRLAANILATTTCTSDRNGQRIGDEITLQGCKPYFRLLQEGDRPNVAPKIWVLKGRHSLVQVGSVPVRNVTCIAVMGPIDTEKVKVITSRMWRPYGKDACLSDGSSDNLEITLFKNI